MPDIPARELFERVRELACVHCGAGIGVRCFTEAARAGRTVPHVERIRAFMRAHPDTTVAGGQIKTRADIKGIR